MTEMTPQPMQNPMPTPPAAQSSRPTLVYIGGGVVLIGVALIGGLYFYFQSQLASTESLEEMKTDIASAYDTIAIINSTTDTVRVTNALKTLRDIAANDQNPPLERAAALNGINFAYTESSFDANLIKEVVFSEPPFSMYYTPSAASGVDPLHPESGADVQAVEAALVKLNELSNALLPNHYALSRMAIAQVFAYQRAAVGKTQAERAELFTSHANTIKNLIAAYDALPPLLQMEPMSDVMKMQIMFVYGSVLEFVGQALDDSSYINRGEQVFIDTIRYGEAYPAGNFDSLRMVNSTLLARIFYASHYWKYYRTSEPEKIRAVLRPLTDVEKVKNTTVHTEYLPTHKEAKVAPFTVLRAVAQGMPELKTYLEGRGWTF